MCVTTQRGACLNPMDQITVSESLASFGYSMDCAEAENIRSLSFDTSDSTTAPEYTGVFVTAGILIFMICSCIIYLFRERKERQIFLGRSEEDEGKQPPYNRAPAAESP